MILNYNTLFKKNKYNVDDDETEDSEKENTKYIKKKGGLWEEAKEKRRANIYKALEAKKEKYNMRKNEIMKSNNIIWDEENENKNKTKKTIIKNDNVNINVKNEKKENEKNNINNNINNNGPIFKSRPRR